jgi:hypothetical protein
MANRTGTSLGLSKAVLACAWNRKKPMTGESEASEGRACDASSCANMRYKVAYATRVMANTWLRPLLNYNFSLRRPGNWPGA